VLGIKATLANYKTFLIILPLSIGSLLGCVLVYFQTKLYVNSNLKRQYHNLIYFWVYLTLVALPSILALIGLGLAGLVELKVIIVRLIFGIIALLSLIIAIYFIISGIFMFHIVSKMEEESAKNYSKVKNAFIFVNIFIFNIGLMLGIFCSLEAYYLFQDYIILSMMSIIAGPATVAISYLMLVSKPKKPPTNISTSGSTSTGIVPENVSI